MKPKTHLLRRIASHVRRSLAEKIGDGRYSYVALNDLDRKLERYLDKDGGFFIEAGANDGFAQSNTYYFEKVRGWTGILIEAIPELARVCRCRRQNSIVVNAALVDSDFQAPEIEINYAGLMSTVVGSFDNQEMAKRHLASGLEVQGLERSYKVKVPALTLTSILDRIKLDRPIDLLSLDVEGYEPNALRGLNFDKYRPQYLCIEVRDRVAVEKSLRNYYREHEILFACNEYRDVLYKSIC